MAFDPAVGAGAVTLLPQPAKQQGDGNLHRADLLAGVAEARCKGVLTGPVQPLQLGSEDLSDGTRIHEPVGVPAGPGINRAVVEAGTTFLRIEVFAFVSYIFLNISVSVLQGIKKPIFAIVIGVYRQVLPFGLFYLLGTTLNMGVKGVWWGIVIINWSAVAITLVYTNYQLHKVEEKKSET